MATDERVSAQDTTDFTVVIAPGLVDQRTGESSLQACEVTTPGTIKQLLKFVEDGDAITGLRSLSSSS